ncbi:DksA/TraR family C4-type zinc finger protein [Marinobacter sp. NP-6]|jgi:phage/conjugal plasmid C-4 type zinc finger TraR family protein|nr:DksA/TraR family C4-type zinc finger protein [Marinobacter sp. NP-6]|tara:strand:+ start:248 stop:607 length:360 start_codon:yes stop_codon:yes gene_type:complete
MAGGWSRDGAVQDQIDASVDDEVQRARSQLVSGESATHCEECDSAIPEARRKAIPGVQLCVACQSSLEKHETSHGGINRRGSKDSQLRWFKKYGIRKREAGVLFPLERNSSKYPHSDEK